MIALFDISALALIFLFLLADIKSSIFTSFTETLTSHSEKLLPGLAWLDAQISGPANLLYCGVSSEIKWTSLKIPALHFCIFENFWFELHLTCLYTIADPKLYNSATF